MSVINDLIKSIPIIPIGSKVIVYNKEFVVIKILFDSKDLTPSYQVSNKDGDRWVVREQITSFKGSVENIKMVDEPDIIVDKPTPPNVTTTAKVEGFDIIRENRLLEDYIKVYGNPDRINGSNIETIDIVSYLTRDKKGRDVEKIIMTHIVPDRIDRFIFKDVYGKKDTAKEHAITPLNMKYENIFKSATERGKALYIHKSVRQYIASKMMIINKVTS